MSNPASLALPARPGVNPTPLAVSLLLILLGAWYLAQAVSGRQSALYVTKANAATLAAPVTQDVTSMMDAGNVLGTRLRPLFGLEVERLKPTAC